MANDKINSHLAAVKSGLIQSRQISDLFSSIKWWHTQAKTTYEYLLEEVPNMESNIEESTHVTRHWLSQIEKYITPPKLED